MSASLVGSEMCIRDRHSPTFVCKGAALLAAQPPARPPAQLPAWPLMEPVSYTHLTLPTICSV
eukprot:9844503-Alexandrium_andersonii.AAC.1